MGTGNHRASRVGRGPEPAAIALAALAGAVLTFLAELWAGFLAPASRGATAFAPAAGVALALLLLLRPRGWYGPLAGVAAGLAGAVAVQHPPAGIAVGHGAGTVAGAVAAALVMRSLSGGRARTDRVRDLLALLAAALLGSVVIGVADAAGRIAADVPAWPAALRAAGAAALGMVVVASAAVALLGRPPHARAIGITALVAGTVLVVADWVVVRGVGPAGRTGFGFDGRVLALQLLAGLLTTAALGLALALRERDRADARRVVATDHFRRTFDRSPVGMAVTTLDGRILEANPTLCRLLDCGPESLVGRTFRSLRPDDSGEHEVARAQVHAVPAAGRAHRLVRDDGTIVWVETSATRLRSLPGAAELELVMVVDATARKELEVKLVHAQKMESVGRLAGSIAHDFNNVLSIMRGQVELLQDDFAVLERARARIDSVQRATDRAAGLTDDLLAFSRRRLDEPEPFDLHAMVLSMTDLLHQVIGGAVELELRLDASSTTVVADPHRVEQALLNLVVNARDAMPHGGQVTISTRNEVAGGSGPAVVLAVADTGVGIDDATQARIFEPFFTTKPPGLGTGLGLSTTVDIVRAAGGTIDVRSEPGRGATFAITFPALEPAVPGADTPADVGGRPPEACTVMVVDDEPEVRTLVTEVLEGRGYHVVAAPDGTTALEVLERDRPDVDLLVTDVVMPVMSGTDLAARFTERSPATRVLFVSGYVPEGAAALHGAPLVSKPLRRGTLLDAVERVLVGAQGTKR